MMKKIFKLFAIALALLLVIHPLPTKANEVLLVDNADILSSDEAANVSNSLQHYSDKHNNDIVIVTVTSTNGKSLQTFADDFFDYNDYGRGNQRNGILMLIDMDSRTIYFSTRGYCTYAFTDYGIYLLENTVIDEIIDYGYEAGCLKFAKEADRYLTLAESGNPIDIEPEPEKEFVPNALGSGILGAIIAAISSFSAKGKNKSVAKKYQANDYKRKGSFKVHNANQWFLYSTVNRTRIERDDSSSHSSGGSTTHVSSSGATHGGGGGRRSF